jgi:hypothetical protein
MTQETTTIPIANNPALVKLSNVENNVLVEDMNYLFHYEKVIRPDLNPSNLFALHFREQQQENWSTCRSLLSKKFTVAKTAMVIEQIQHNLGGRMENEKHYRSDTSVKSSFILSGFQIDVADEPEMDLILFKLITNINAEIQILTSSKLTFNVINGFSGNHALQLNYGLLKTITTRIGDLDHPLPINNVFILDKFTKRLIHDDRLSISIEDVTNVQRSLAEQVVIFKRYRLTQDMADNFADETPKKFAKQFLALYEALPENLRNFYYCSYIWSVLLDSERKINLEIKLRSLVAIKINQLIKASQSDNVRAA